MAEVNYTNDLPDSTRSVLSSLPDIFEDVRYLWNTPDPTPAPTPVPAYSDTATPSPIPNAAEHPTVRPIVRVTPYTAPRVGHDLTYMSPQIAYGTPQVTFQHAYLETQIHVLSPSLWQFFVFGRLDYTVGSNTVVIDVCLSKFVSVPV